VTIAFVQDHNALIAAMAVVFECYFSMLGVKSWRMLCKMYVLFATTD